MAEKKNAEDLKCGDVFVYLKDNWVALSNFTDERHTQTIITAVLENNISKPLKGVSVFRFFRTCKLEIVGKRKLKLEAVLSPEVSITDKDQSELNLELALTRARAAIAKL